MTKSENPAEVTRDALNPNGQTTVIWQDPGSGLAQVLVFGGGQGTTLLSAANLTSSNTWRIVGMADFNRDSIQDVVWQDATSGAAQVWFLGGPQNNVVTGAAVLSYGNSWRIRAIADFNRDGHPDCIWQDQSSGWAQIWFMSGTQGTTVTGAVNLTARNTWRIVGAADFNRDTRIDVLWQDPVSGAIQAWYLGGTQGNSIIDAITLTASNSWKVAAAADFNGDGYPDLILQDPATGASTLWLLGGSQGATVIGSVAFSAPNPWRIAGAANPLPPPILQQPTVSGSSISLTWTYPWPAIVSSNDGYRVEESTISSTSGFVQIADIASTTSPYTLSVARTLAATYYYRVRAVTLSGPTPYSEVRTATTVPAQTITRFVNNTSYILISLILDSTQRLSQSLSILPGRYLDLPVSQAQHSYSAANGFWQSGSRFEMYRWTGTYTQPAGTYTITFPDPTINQLLTQFNASGTGYWSGEYWDNYSVPHAAGFRFRSSGSWTFYNDGQSVGTGTYSLVRRDPSSFTVEFTIGGYNGLINELGGYFYMRNGPSSWPVIQYTYQGP